MNLRLEPALLLCSAILGCNGTLTVGLSKQSSTGTPSGTTGTSAAASSSSSTGGVSSTTSGGTTGGTTSGKPGCGNGLACFGDRCLTAECSVAARGAACSLGDAGIGACRGGACQPPAGNDPENCLYPGASCPIGLTCGSGGACLDGQGNTAEACDGLACPAGRVCELIGYLGPYCLRSTCGPADDDLICGTGLDGGRALLDNRSDPSFCCGSACVDTGSDPGNCGGCGIACGPNAVCQAPASDPTQGSCMATSCGGRADDSPCLSDAGPGACCAGRCAQVGSDLDNCGVCGRSCRGTDDAGFQCAGGRCAEVGPPVDCSQGQPCPAGSTCALGGSCVTDCAQAPDGVSCGASLTERFVRGNRTKSCCNHRCIDPSLDPANCGSCGQACDAGDSCLLGACERTDCAQASGGFTPCPLADGGGGICCGGACVDSLSDGRNCGLCGDTCGGPSSCELGACTDAGPTPCGGACPTGTRCSLVDELCHPLDCGPTDTNNLCAFGDGGGLQGDLGICCGGACINPLFDADNCLACGAACGVGDTCFQIGCGEGHATCGMDAGHQCAAGLVCLQDVICEPLSCEGRSNGDACLYGFTSSGPNVGVCCGQRCVDTTQDPLNCGGCGMVAHGGLCMDYQTSTSCIDSACADLSSDPLHCGDCLVACPAGQTCSGGTCSGSPGCGPGRRDGLCAPDAGLGSTGLPLLCCAGEGCVDFSSDGQNCGFCGNVCPFAGLDNCRDGKCQPPP